MYIIVSLNHWLIIAVFIPQKESLYGPWGRERRSRWRRSGRKRKRRRWRRDRGRSGRGREGETAVVAAASTG